MSETRRSGGVFGTGATGGKREQDDNGSGGTERGKEDKHQATQLRKSYRTLEVDGILAYVDENDRRLQGNRRATSVMLRDLTGEDAHILRRCFESVGRRKATAAGCRGL